jgi:hypothetical protein
MTRFVRALLATLVGLGAGVAVLVAAALPASACSCAVVSSVGTPGEAQAAFDAADVVFTGRIVDRDEPLFALGGSSGDRVILTFAVDAVHKGTATTRQRLGTAASGASCGLEIVGEGPFLVFATADGDGLTASLCGGTSPQVSLATWPATVPAPAPDGGWGAWRTTAVAGIAVVAVAGLLLLRHRRRSGA